MSASLKFVIALVVSLVLMGCGGGAVSTVSTTASNAWDITNSSGMPSHPTQAGTGWYFDFPQAPGHVNYVTEDFSGVVSHQVSLTFTITGTGTFESIETPPRPPNVSLMLQTRGDDMQEPFGRWWAAASITTLAPGTYTVTVPLDPSQWSGVYGTPANNNVDSLAAFNNDLNGGLGHVGFTFGGGCCLGHGVFVNGNARFTLVSYIIN